MSFCAFQATSQNSRWRPGARGKILQRMAYDTMVTVISVEINDQVFLCKRERALERDF